MNSADELFNRCIEIAKDLANNQEKSAREKVINLLDYLEQNHIQYTPLVNAVIREVGLYPYMNVDCSNWQDAYVCNLFRADIGGGQSVTLHREQFRVLNNLVEGKSIAVSAPTSFGKSFIIDAFIQIKKPKNIAIIVPTISLMDETRRRLYKKFSSEYHIITAGGMEIKEKNIFIFPQERAFSYINLIDSLDILVVDEFYKSSEVFDKDRSAALVSAMIKLGKKAKQKYYLAPNITTIKNSPLTEGLLFLHLDFNTVFLEVNDYFSEINKEKHKDKREKKKEGYLQKLNSDLKGKTLVYAGSKKEVSKAAKILCLSSTDKKSPLLSSFSKWLIENYKSDWELVEFVRKGIGIHHGSIPRCLSQIQVKLFEEKDGLDRLVSTSSIIEGVNTSAENVIVWFGRGPGVPFSPFSYKNLIGRAGRMFKYFIGHIYLLVDKPNESEIELELSIPQKALGEIDPNDYSQYLTEEQKNKIWDYDSEMNGLIGPEYLKLKKNGEFQTHDSQLLKRLAISLKEKPKDWECLKNLNSEKPDLWTKPLLKVLTSSSLRWEEKHKPLIKFIQLLSLNWKIPQQELLLKMEKKGFDIEACFKLEREVTYKLVAILNDINFMQAQILKESTDLSSFIRRLSSAFLPPTVFLLEEYGLPRTMAKKISKAKIVDLECEALKIEEVLDKFRSLNKEKVERICHFDEFERYIYSYFLDGITASVNEKSVLD